MAERGIAILADDLTGAGDSAVAMLVADEEAEVQLECGQLPDAFAAPRVLSIDLHTRCLSASEARRHMAWAGLDALASGRHLFKKIDSTLRGHLGAELAALAEVMEPSPLFVVAPAHPVLGRTLHQGRLHVHGVLADRPLLADDLAVHGVPGISLESGAIALTASLSEASRRKMPVALVCDASSTQDLQAIVDAALRIDRPVVWVGSGGLAQALGERLSGGSIKDADRRRGTVLDVPPIGRRLFVVGSHSAVARAQVDALAATGRVDVIDLALPALIGDDHVSFDRIEAAWSTERDVLLRPDPAWPVDDASLDAVANGLARCARPLVDGAKALVVCGGDTARALLSRLGIQQLHVRAWTEPGTTLARSAAWPTLPIALKAGAFGDAGLLTRLGATFAPSSNHS